MKAALVAGLGSLLAVAAAPPAPHVDMQRMSDVTRTLASDPFQGRARRARRARTGRSRI